MEPLNNGAMISFIFIFGLVIGSFLNCFVWRVRQKEGIVDRSYCPHCGHQLAWYDNIPLLSYVMLKGKCRYCSRRISVQYPLVELAAGLLFAVSFMIRSGEVGATGGIFSLTLVRDWFVISVLIFIFIYDLRWYLILDRIIIPSCVSVLILNLFLGFEWWDLLFSAMLGGGFFLAQFLISGGAWIGGGDIRLGMFMGLALGSWQYLAVALFAAYLLGSLVAIPLILTQRKKWGEKVPFGVFLSAATIIALFWGGEVLSWYMGYLGY